MPASRSVASLIYHDIFDYPLSETELERWRSAKGIERSVKIQKTGSYYHLAGRASIVRFRKEREKESARKLKIARRFATKLSGIRTIRFIGITGSLAMNNAKRESDIDLMVVTNADTLWSTRLMVKIVALFSGFAIRNAGGAEAKDAICFNMWLDEKHLAIPSKMRNLYTAHEVLQVVPLLNRDQAFEKFLEANNWATKYWPNAKPRIKIEDLRMKNLYSAFFILYSLMEPIAYHLQRLYMSPRKTRETVEKGRAFFHPIDWSSIVLREFKKRIDNLIS